MFHCPVPIGSHAADDRPTDRRLSFLLLVTVVEMPLRGWQEGGEVGLLPTFLQGRQTDGSSFESHFSVEPHCITSFVTAES